MRLKMAALGGLGYAAYNYYTKNREQVDGTIRRLTGSDRNDMQSTRTDGVQTAGGPISSDARLAHAGEGPVT